MPYEIWGRDLGLHLIEIIVAGTDQRLPLIERDRVKAEKSVTSLWTYDTCGMHQGNGEKGAETVVAIENNKINTPGFRYEGLD